MFFLISLSVGFGPLGAELARIQRPDELVHAGSEGTSMQTELSFFAFALRPSLSLLLLWMDRIAEICSVPMHSLMFFLCN